MSKSLIKNLLALLAISLILIGCKENTTEPVSEPSTNKEAMLKLADEDSAISSFEPSFNEEDIMSFIGKVQTDIYPFRVGHKMRLVNRNMNINYSANGDTAFAQLTKTFEGVLLIAASYDSSAAHPDTLIKKAFTSVVKRNLIFVKIGNFNNPSRNWRLAAISLPEGGTLSPNIDITKLVVFLPNGDTLAINSPNNYFLKRGPGWWRDFPIVPRQDSVLIRVELTSAYSEDDFVTLTWGAHKDGKHRAKRKFDLVSSTQNGNVYNKVYEQYFRTNAHAGFFHAVINALPKQVIFDDAAPVENEMWGVPYIVRN